jgi:hypothetical protein
MRFAHIADCHIGAWRDPKMSDISIAAFHAAVDRTIEKNVDFLLISGDLFNTSLPGIDKIKSTVKALRRLKEKQIPVYSIAGSHDFSPSGKTMLDVLEHADLLVNVCKGTVFEGALRLNFTTDPKTGAKITGMVGKKGMLDKTYYESLDKDNLEKETGFKIFLFHTAITELKPGELALMESAPASILPKGFNYYAGGHVHIINKADIDQYKNIVYPGPTFPNSFSELEKLGRGGFYIYEDGRAEHSKIEISPTVSVHVKCDHKSAQEAQEMILDALNAKNINTAIVTIRVSGQLSSGKPSDIEWSRIFETQYERGAYVIMKNTNQLTVQEYNSIMVACDSTEDVESRIIDENIGQINSGTEKDKEKTMIIKLMQALNKEKSEGQTISDHEDTILAETSRIVNQQNL